MSNFKELAAALEGKVSGRVELDRPLAPLTTYRLGGPAALFLEAGADADLAALAALRAQLMPGTEVLVLGRGSNVLVADRGFDGIVVQLGKPYHRIAAAGESGALAGGATPQPLLANWTARRGLAGLEHLVGIPGSVGGAVRMNAGAHGTEVSDTLRDIRLLDLDTGEARSVDAAELGLAYRRSNLTPAQVVLEASFDLRPEGKHAVRARVDAYRRHRAETQPGALQNAGSTFKNPPGDHAGRLVDAAGLKGFAVGGVRVSELHANFFVASPGATAADVHRLIGEVARRVKDATGVTLEPEIRFVGDFGGAAS